MNLKVILYLLVISESQQPIPIRPAQMLHLAQINNQKGQFVFHGVSQMTSVEF